MLSVMLLLSVIILPAYALSDAEFLKMKKNSAAFAKADKELTQAYKDAKANLSKSDFAELQKEQRKWIASGRDKRAKALMKEGLSRVKAYTQATNERADEIRELFSEDNPIDDEEDYDEDEDEEELAVVKPKINNSSESEKLNGYFVNVDDEDFGIEFKLADAKKNFYSIKISAIQDLLTESGTLKNGRIEIEEGDHEITIKVLDNDTLEIETNQSFKNDNGYSIDGRYERVEAVG